MKAGDLIRMVTGLPGHSSDPRNAGLLISVEERQLHGQGARARRIATVMTASGELVTWPLDSHYEVKVINEDR